MGLEPYKARYTLQLQEWSRAVFERRGIDYVIVPGETLTNDQAIVTGQVLDAHGRSYFGMSQIMNLVRYMKQGEVTSEDVIFFEDMFQPGIESLPYIMDQITPEMRPRVYVRCLAQTIDPDDFVHVWDMTRWMTHYERMVNEFATVLATNEEMVAHMRVAGWTADIYNISGLSFGKAEVLSRVNNQVRPFDSRKKRVVFAARWDQEKQPDFFMDIIDAWHRLRPNEDVEFALLSGSSLRSNNSSYMARTLEMQQQGRLTVYQDLDKNQYYDLLNDSRVMFNCALQDWVSNTVSEADALGCNVVYPAYRSFPETFANDWTRLYVPWSVEDALKKIDWWLAAPHPRQGQISDWNDGTIDRMLDIMQGQGGQWLRMDSDYRRHARTSKY
jgi:hypothetical protein